MSLALYGAEWGWASRPTRLPEGSLVPQMPAPEIAVWQASEFGGLDLLRGTFTTHAFARHAHATYSIGMLD